jgi:hypothetical protein
MAKRWLHLDVLPVSTRPMVEPRAAEPVPANPTLLFTENETNTARVFGWVNGACHTKDAFYRYLVAAELDAVNPEHRGTKASAHNPLTIPAGESCVVRVRLNDAPLREDMFRPSSLDRVSMTVRRGRKGRPRRTAARDSGRPPHTARARLARLER